MITGLQSLSIWRRAVPTSLRFMNVLQNRSYFENKFDLEAQEKILQVLSTPDVDLTPYTLAKKYRKTVVNHCNNNGPLQSLDDLLLLLDHKVLQKFYTSIVSDGVNNKRQKSKIKPPLRPAENLDNYTEALSICLAPNNISWSSLKRLDKDRFELESTGSHHISVSLRTHFLPMLQQIQEAVAEIPPCELYIVEEYVHKVTAARNAVPYIVQKTHIQSFMLGMLAIRNNGRQQIVALKNMDVARVMNLKIGFEKVSGQSIVEELFKQTDAFTVNPATHFSYCNIEKNVQKEHIANAVVLNVAFWKLQDKFPSYTMRQKEQ